MDRFACTLTILLDTTTIQRRKRGVHINIYKSFVSVDLWNAHIHQRPFRGGAIKFLFSCVTSAAAMGRIFSEFLTPSHCHNVIYIRKCPCNYKHFQMGSEFESWLLKPKNLHEWFLFLISCSPRNNFKHFFTPDHSNSAWELQFLCVCVCDFPLE